MPELRRALHGAGFEDVRTYVQSGNVVLTTDLSTESLTRSVAGLVAERFGVDNGVVARTAGELADVVARNPLASLASDPRRHQVTFLAGAPRPEAVQELEAAALGDERLVHVGRELYSWHPHGIGRSKLARLLSGKRLGVLATTRNWATVTALLSLATE